MKKTIYFLRHGQTEYNKLGIVQGSGIDSSLDERGKEQAKALFNQYKDLGFDLALASALKRTQETLLPFVETGVPIECYAEINEISWGVQEGAEPSAELWANYKEVRDAWEAGNYEARVEGGESAAELYERVSRFFDMLKGRTEQKIIVCTHGRTMSTICCILENRPLSDMGLFRHENTAVTKTTFDGKSFEVEIHSDISHLN